MRICMYPLLLISTVLDFRQVLNRDIGWKSPSIKVMQTILLLKLYVLFKTKCHVTWVVGAKYIAAEIIFLSKTF